MSAMTRFFTPDPETKHILESNLLMWDMVRAMDIDLAGAVRREDLPLAQLGTMLRKCHGCAFADMCTLFLERREGRTSLAPSYCVNRAQLAALRTTAPNPPAASALRVPKAART